MLSACRDNFSSGRESPQDLSEIVGDPCHPYNVFDFTLNRGRDGPQQFLKDYNQVLLADAYGGYPGVVVSNQMTRAGCWAHARRKFIDAEKAAPQIAQEAVGLIRMLYAVEKQAQDLAFAQRLHHSPAQREQLVQLLPFAGIRIHPAGQQQPALVFHHTPHRSALRTSSTAALACCIMRNVS